MEDKKYESPYPKCEKEKEPVLERVPLDKQQSKRKNKDRKRAQLKKRQQRQLRRMKGRK